MSTASFAPEAEGARTSTPARRAPGILVLLACYNGAPWVGEQLESILAQQGVDLTIVVRDDGSSDATVSEIARFRDDVRVRVCAGEVPTGSGAQNFLTLIRDNPADGHEFIAFADQDDLWYRDKLARACRMLTDDGAACGYSSATVATWPNGRTAVLTRSARSTPADFLFEGAGQGCTYVLRADFYARLRAFVTANRRLTDGVLYHDWMVYALARSWGLRWLFDRSPSMLYRQHESNDTGARHTWAGIMKRFDRIRRGWYRDQLAAIGSICLVAAPTNPVVRSWTGIFLSKTHWLRRARIALFCLRGVRRRRSDNVAMAAAAMAGWI